MDAEKHERIAKRAYALWQAEGQPDGRHEEHWYYAAREIAAADSTNSAAKRSTGEKSAKRENVWGRRLAVCPLGRIGSKPM
jgi:hypothetical protein